MNKFAELPFPIDHPLLVDRPRLERITNNMSVQIQRMIYGAVVSKGMERILHDGQSVDDVLSEALIALLRYDAADLTGSWEGLSVVIARRKAVDAIRHSTKGRRSAGAAPEEPDEIVVVSLEAMAGSGGIESHVADGERDPAFEFMLVEQQRVLLRIARDCLSDREKAVFFGIHYFGRAKVDLAREVGISPQGVGQMYARIARRLLDEARRDPAFPHNEDGPEGGPHD